MSASSRTGRMLSPVERLEMALQSDMQERGRRLRAHLLMTAEKVWVEIEPGEWRKLPKHEADGYETVPVFTRQRAA